jgi:hypothetical protein
VRTLFMTYLVLTIAGLVLYTVVGLAHY